MVVLQDGYKHECLFFVKQKTAYDMRISDWSSDVCSSDFIGAGEVAEMGDRFAQARIKRGVGLFGRQVFGPDMRDRARQFADAGQLQSFVGKPGEEVTIDLDILLDDAGRPDRSAECRSEEHTSELQSLMRISYAVFCLKKKQPHD